MISDAGFPPWLESAGQLVMKRLLIACGLPVVRYGLVKLVEEYFHEAVIAEAATAGEALQRVREAAWDLAVVGLGFDGPGRLELLKALKALRPKLAVLVFSKHAEDLYARRTFKAGAAGYVTADSSRAKVVQAIQKVMSGGRYVSPQLAEAFAADLDSRGGDPPHLALSDREFEVMQLLASGRTVGEIASMLFLSVPTISTHRARLLLKLSIRNNAQLTRYALENKLIE
jgi:two-component system invasion response regulator UvrY